MPAEPLPDFLAWWNFGDPAGTEKRFRELLPKAEAAKDLPYLVRLHTQIARTESLQRKFDACHATLDRTERLLRPDMHEGRTRCRLERGRAWNSGKSPEKAKPLFLEALDAAKQGGEDGLAVDAAHMLGIAEKGAAALTWSLKALQMAEESRDPRAQRWRGTLYNNLGWTCFEQGDLARAAEYHKKNWDWHVEAKQASGARIGKWATARVLRALGRLDEALALQKELLEESERRKEEDGYVCEELAEIVLAQGHATEAKPWFRKAHAALAKDADFARDEAKRLKRLEDLGAAPAVEAR
jgi:tetratricopeptide (TPR) repeat protein